MKRNKTVWFEVSEDETVSSCLNRIASEGYSVTGKKEIPVFSEVNGEVIPVQQIIKFSGVLTEKKSY